MNRIGFPVTLRDEAAGTSRVVKVPLSPDDIFARLVGEGLFDDQENIEPHEVEVVGHFSEQSITIRFWSPLASEQARVAIAVLAGEWERTLPGEVLS